MSGCMYWIKDADGNQTLCGAEPVIREWGEERCPDHADMTMVAALEKLREIQAWLSENNVNFPGLAEQIKDMEPEQ